jgi:putative acetyltransferase
MAQQIVIRPIHPSDATDLHAALSHPSVAAQTRQLPTLDVVALRERIEQADFMSPRLVAEVDGRAVGRVKLNRSHNPRRVHGAKLGMYVHPDYWRQGIGTALMAAALDAADNWLNLLRVELTVYTDNPVAIALYDKFGFVEEGIERRSVFGPNEWRDSVMMARLRVPTYDPPLQTTPLLPVVRVAEVGEIVIRPKIATDAQTMYVNMLHHNVARTVSMPPFVEAVNAVTRFASHSPTDHIFVAETDGKLVGNLGLHQDRNPRRAHVAALGMSVDARYWGHGIGSQLMATALDFADNWLNVQRIELEVNTDNPAGVRLYEKFGFEREGLKRLHIFGAGRFADSYIMARVR